MPLFLAFLIVPLIEIALFIQIGGAIGLWPTLATVVLTAFLGASLVRSQGRSAIDDLSKSFQEIRDPTEPLAHGAMIVFAGALLLTPGFFTDAVGFLLLIPGVRAAVYRYVRSRVEVQTFQTRETQGFQSGAEWRDDVIEGEFREAPPKGDAPQGDSGWTKH